MITRILLALALGAFVARTSLAATIDPELIDSFEKAAPEARLPVMILLDDTPDLAGLQARARGLAFGPRRDAVVRTLKEHAAVSQAPLREMVDRQLARGKPVRARSLWTVNALALEADRDLVEALARVDVAGRVVLDERFDLLSGVTAARERMAAPSSPSTPGGDGVSRAPVVAWSVDWIGAPAAWDLGYTGVGVVVAHIDSGVYQAHPDLQNRLWVNAGEIPGNQIDDDDNGYVDDVHGYDFANGDGDPEDDGPAPNGGHGTHTAGTVAGDGAAGTQTGVAPGASVMICKVFPTSGGGATFSDIYEAHQYALDNGARLITQSLGVAGPDIPDWLMRSERLNGDALRAAGVVLFAAAGNDHSAYDPPFELGVTARVPAPWSADPVLHSSRGGIVSVGGTYYKSNGPYPDSSNGPADWSAIDPWNDWIDLVKPDVAAPGVGINSTIRNGTYSGDSWSGTSMSTPHVAGVAALMLEKNPSLTPEQIDEILETTAVDLGDPGKDNVFGAGIVDALAAVEGVPATAWPHLVRSGVTILDAGGDGIIDPGESFELVFELTNNSTVANATSVAASLDVLPNPHVSLVDGAATFPDILAGGGAQTNAGDTFALTAAAEAPQGFLFTVNLTLAADGGYQKEIDTTLFVGLPDYLDHDAGAVVLTVTDQATLGYMSDDQAEGRGFGPAGGSSALFIGSLWAGTDVNYICNRDFSGAPSSPERYEWRTVTDPNGRMQKLGAVKSDQDFRAIYSDAGAASPKAVRVTQRSFAWADEGYNEFVLILYTITNNGGTTLTDWHAGVFCDWDVGDATTNRGNSEVARQVAYVYDNSGKHAGVAYLGEERVANLSMIDNETHVYPESKIPDGTKVGFLKGRKSTYQVPQSTGPADWSAITSVGPFDLAPGQTVHLPFAVVYGTSLEVFQANVDRAHERWLDADIVAIAPPPGETPPPVERRLTLAQNRPNPFNPSTTIFFSIEKSSPVRMVVYDLAGREVRTLADREYEAGDWSVTWDGMDDAGRAMPSGLYLYRLETANRILSRKMMLVK